MTWRGLLPLSFAIVLVLGAATCTSEVAGDNPTALRVVTSFDAGWALSQLSFTAGSNAATVPGDPAELQPDESTVILLPDDAAGEPMELAVWGLVAGNRVAFARASATPELHRTVDVEVTLVHLPCGAWCTEGSTECAGDGFKTCLPLEGDPCLGWSETVPCTADAPWCSLGRCSDECVDECAPGEQRCAGPSGVQICGPAETDSDPCLDWLPPLPCPDGSSCEAGSCKTGDCADECQAGETQCAGGGASICGQFDADDCIEWGPAVPCAEGQSCSNGVCTEGCEDECSSSECGPASWKQCGQFDFDTCQELSAGAPCTPSDACQEGSCDPVEGCSSAPKTCNAPPDNDCIDGDTLEVYQSMGVCQEGACEYHAEQIDCPNCPNCDPCASVVCDQPPSECFAPTGMCTNNGSCSYAYNDGAACAGADACSTGYHCQQGVCTGTPISCTTPPASTCADALSLRKYLSPGACGGGTCSYPSIDAVCSDGCDGNVCSFSNENPCKGTESHIYTTGQGSEVALTRLTPPGYPFTVTHLRYYLSGSDAGVSCNSALPHQLVMFKSSAVPPPASPVVTTEAFTSNLPGNESIQIDVNLDPAIALSAGEHLYVGLVMPSGLCLAVCDDFGMDDRNYWSNSAAAPYAWGMLATEGLDVNLRIEVAGE